MSSKQLPDLCGCGAHRGGRSYSRREFLWFFLLNLLATRGLLFAQESGDLQRGGKVKWARLKTPSASWHRHARGDPDMLSYVRQNTSLNIEDRSYWADVAKLSQMCAYPLLFSEGTHWVESHSHQQNIAEYLRRGGFLLIDSCIAVNHDADAYFASESTLLSANLPEAKIHLLENSHDIFHCFFDMREGIPHTFYNNIYDPSWARYGLHGVYLKDRLAGVISLSGLQCGWDNMVAPPGHNVECMKMLVNIYTYALTH